MPHAAAIQSRNDSCRLACEVACNTKPKNDVICVGTIANNSYTLLREVCGRVPDIFI
jgi:hypothetical protein